MKKVHYRLSLLLYISTNLSSTAVQSAPTSGNSSVLLVLGDQRDLDICSGSPVSTIPAPTPSSTKSEYATRSMETPGCSPDNERILLPENGSELCCGLDRDSQPIGCMADTNSTIHPTDEAGTERQPTLNENQRNRNTARAGTGAQSNHGISPASLYLKRVVCPRIDHILELDGDPENYIQMESRPQTRPDPALDFILARHYFTNLIEICETCECDEYTNGVRAVPTSEQCQTEETAMRCRDWLRCTCEIHMLGYVGYIESDAIGAYSRALEQVPRWLKERNPHYRLRTGNPRTPMLRWGPPRDGLYDGMEHHGSDRYLVQDSVEPYFLEGRTAKDDIGGPLWPKIANLGLDIIPKQLSSGISKRGTDERKNKDQGRH
ncbi:hypothetical protein TWF730_007358 [Orbilia blumenaviensis]|uniref:Uncharacterized protein n=1 Tax=Orbilia blumenaviensis TaxID=1796055 RepID=A0AAV9VAA6_9PEZI